MCEEKTLHLHEKLHSMIKVNAFHFEIVECFLICHLALMCESCSSVEKYVFIHEVSLFHDALFIQGSCLKYDTNT